MIIDQKTIIKYFDLVIKDLKDVTFFSVSNTLTENNHFNTNSDKERKEFVFLTKSIKEFALTFNYFEAKGSNGWLKLTQTGIDLKNSNLGHVKYNKRSKKQSMTRFEKLSLLFIALGLIFSVYQFNINDSLKNENESIKSKHNSLIIKTTLYKKQIDSLTNTIEEIKLKPKKVNL